MAKRRYSTWGNNFYSLKRAEEYAQKIANKEGEPIVIRQYEAKRKKWKYISCMFPDKKLSVSEPEEYRHSGHPYS